jgi:L-lactate utilization protein LutB
LADKREYRRDHVPQRQEYHRRYYEVNREQIRANTDRNRRDRLEWLRNLKLTLKCSRCGESHPACLDFHHLDPKTKEGLIGQMANRGLSEQRILAEIEKCIVLCANCHRKEHWR